eukprot:scaffold14965_cov23-Tisochrysis_lutea.AAC.4
MECLLYGQRQSAAALQNVLSKSGTLQAQPPEPMKPTDCGRCSFSIEIILIMQDTIAECGRCTCPCLSLQGNAPSCAILE